MSETAEIYQHQEKNGAQLENGYTKIANELLEKVMASPFTLREMRVVMAVIRLTYGWHRKQARIPGGFLAKLTGLPATKASETLSSLVAKNVITRHGGSRSPVSLNKRSDQWLLSPNERKTPPPKQARNAEIYQTGQANPKWYHSYQIGKSECYQNGKASKERKDKTKSTYVLFAYRLPPNTLLDLRQNHFPLHYPKAKTLPNCPHQDIIDLWSEIMPEKPQPSKNLWSNTARASNLAARWRAGFKIKHELTGKPLYTTKAEGIEWWGKLFRFLRKSDFLMQDHRWFKLDWVANKTNFTKIMEQSYHGSES